MTNHENTTLVQYQRDSLVLMTVLSFHPGKRNGLSMVIAPRPAQRLVALV